MGENFSERNWALKDDATFNIGFLPLPKACNPSTPPPSISVREPIPLLRVGHGMDIEFSTCSVKVRLPSLKRLYCHSEHQQPCQCLHVFVVDKSAHQHDLSLRPARRVTRRNHVRNGESGSPKFCS